MTLQNLISELNLEVLTETSTENTSADGCYICDLLSLAMSKVSAKDVWVTVQVNVNIVAVAVLTEASCVLIAEGMNVEQSVIDKANSQDVIILRTDKSAFEIAVKIGEML